MFKNFHKLFTPEAFSLINPKGLVNQIIKFFRLCLGNIPTHSSKTVSYKDSVVKQRYTFVTIKDSDVRVVRNFNISGDGLIAGGSSSPLHAFNYQCTIDGDWTILGCGYTEKMAVLGVDYIIKNGYYWFKEHPSIFCYATEDSGDVFYLTVGFGGSYKQVNRHYAPESSLFSNPDGALLYDTMLRNGFKGLDNSKYLALQGISATKGLTGVVEHVWKHDNMVHATTSSGTLIHAPEGCLKLVKGKVVDYVHKHPETFTVKLNDVYYPVMFKGNKLDNYPGLLDKYPTLTVVNGVFHGSELLQIMRDKGYKHVEITDSTRSVKLRDCSLLSNITLYLGTVTIPVPLSCASNVAVNLTKEVTFPDTLFKDISIKFKYM